MGYVDSEYILFLSDEKYLSLWESKRRKDHE